MSRVIDFVDTTTRDGNQSLWGATGLTTPDVLAIAPAIDRVGYHALDFTSSTHMAVSVRYHREDPWERIRRMSEAMPQHLAHLPDHGHALHLVGAGDTRTSSGSSSARSCATACAGSRSPSR